MTEAALSEDWFPSDEELLLEIDPVSWRDHLEKIFEGEYDAIPF